MKKPFKNCKISALGLNLQAILRKDAMNITIIGSGYVGLVAGASFAGYGFDVCCYDSDLDKINLLKSGKIHIHEPGLKEQVKKGLQNHLTFSNDISSLDAGNILIIAVGTPEGEDGSADLVHIDAVVRDIATVVTKNKYIIIKSTVPVGTAEMVKKKLAELRPELQFEVISNPEFLREGSALRDFNEPDRIVIGCASREAKLVAKTLYKPLISKDVPIFFTTNINAEIIKYAANSYLAMRIAFINEMADICEKIDADIEEVAQGIGYDKRIGRHYLHAGPGFGGSCFPKDTKALAKIASDYGTRSNIIDAVIFSNRKRKENMAIKILNALGNPKDKTIAVLGLTFKADTDDMRDSPSLVIIPKLLEAGVKVQAYDPSNPAVAIKIFASSITFMSSVPEVLKNVDAMVILTEWPEFKLLDFNQVKKIMKTPLIIDLRNLFNTQEVKDLGIKYVSVGRKDA